MTELYLNRIVNMSNSASKAKDSKGPKTKLLDAGSLADKSMGATNTAERLENVPLQIRIPKNDSRRIKVAAAERDQTISQFLLTCFRAYVK